MIHSLKKSGYDTQFKEIMFLQTGKRDGVFIESLQR